MYQLWMLGFNCDLEGKLIFKDFVVARLFRGHMWFLQNIHKLPSAVSCQVVACTSDKINGDVLKPYSLPSKIICRLNKIDLKVTYSPHTCQETCSDGTYVGAWSGLICDWVSYFSCKYVQADPQTDEVYAQMDLTPLEEVLLKLIVGLQFISICFSGNFIIM